MDLVNYRKYGFRIYFTYFILFYAILIFDIEPLSTYSKSFGLIGNIMCFPLFWKGIQCHDDEYKKPWKSFLTASIIYFIGELIYAYQTDIVGVEPEAPSVCDIFYFTNTCVLYVGLILYLKSIQKIDLHSISLDMIISIFATGGLIYHFIMLPLIKDESSTDLFMIFINLYNPVMDFALLAALFLFFFGTDIMKFLTPTNMLMGVALIFLFCLDQFSLMIDLYDLNIAVMIDPLWTLFYMLVALASLYPKTESAIKSGGNLLTTLVGYIRILLPYIYTFMILFLVGMEYNIMQSLFIWAILLVFMLSMRQIFVLVSNEKLMARIRRNEVRLNLQNIELQKLNEKIMHDAEVDFLTQLYNRRRIDKVFEKLAPKDGEEKTIGIILIDVDYFKHINDTFGHQIGDKVLKKVAASIRSVVRDNDLAGRFGGDEFIIVLPDANVVVAEDITKNLVSTIRREPELRIYGVTLSVGCTSCSVTADDYNVKNMLKKADDALYVAKENGRNQYVVG